MYTRHSLLLVTLLTIAHSSTNSEKKKPVVAPRKRSNDQSRVDSNAGSSLTDRHPRPALAPKPQPGSTRTPTKMVSEEQGNSAVGRKTVDGTIQKTSEARKGPQKPPRMLLGKGAENEPLSATAQVTAQMKKTKRHAPTIPEPQYESFESLLAEGKTNVLDSTKASNTEAGDVGSIANEDTTIVSDEGRVIFQPSHDGETLIVKEMMCPTRRSIYDLPKYPHPEKSYYLFPEGLSKFLLSFGIFKSVTRSLTYEIKASSSLEDSLKILYMGLVLPDGVLQRDAVEAPAARAALIVKRLCHFVQSDVQKLEGKTKDVKVNEIEGVEMLKSDYNEPIPFAELHGTEPLKSSPIAFTFLPSTVPNLNFPIVTDERVVQLNANDLKVTKVTRAKYKVESEDFNVLFEVHAEYFRLMEMRCPGRWYSEKSQTPTDFVFKDGASVFSVAFEGSNLLKDVTEAKFELPNAENADSALKWLLRGISADAPSLLDTIKGTDKSDFLMKSSTPEGFLIRNICRQKGSPEYKKDSA